MFRLGLSVYVAETPKIILSNTALELQAVWQLQLKCAVPVQVSAFLCERTSPAQCWFGLFYSCINHFRT